jgi:hypothetical protein
MQKNKKEEKKSYLNIVASETEKIKEKTNSKSMLIKKNEKRKEEKRRRHT